MGDDRLQLRSDTDEQLILHLVFSEAVKVHSLNLVAPEMGEYVDGMPHLRKVKLLTCMQSNNYGKTGIAWYTGL